MSERIGAKTFAKKYLPGSVGMDEIGFQSFDFSPMQPKLQTFRASIRLSSRVRHLNIKVVVLNITKRSGNLENKL